MPTSKTNPLHTSEPRLLLFALLFFFSGAAGLIYQIVWERLLEIYFGVTQVSITLIVGAFMAGLGIGSLLGGRVAQRVRSTLVAYGLLEIGIGMFGLASLGLINAVGQSSAGAPYALVFALSFLVLLFPTVLMGMTLPLLSQSFITRVENSGRIIGLLYGINTLGAALGGLVSAYGLIGINGLSGTNNFAVAINLLVGLGSLALARRDRAHCAPAARQAAAAKRSAGWGYSAILTAAFLVGFIGLGYEMLWMRLLAILNKSTAYLFPSMLFVFLIALAIGGFVWGRRADHAKDPYALFWKIEVAAAMTAVLTFLLADRALELPAVAGWLKTNFMLFQQPDPAVIETEAGMVFSRLTLLKGLLNYFLPICVLVFPTGLIQGGGLPVLDRIAIESPAVAGRRVGDVHVANILGSVGGTLAVSFCLLPAIGSEGVYKLLAGLSLIFPALYLWNLARRRAPIRPVPGQFLPPLLLLALIVILPGRGDFYAHLFTVASGTVLAQTEGGDTLLTLTTDPNGNQRLWIGGETHSQFPSEGLYAAQAAACASATRVERVLVIGLGGGHSAAFYASLPSLRELAIVELARDLQPFLVDQFPFVRNLSADPRVTYTVDDGRRWLYAHPDKRFDLIAIDPLRRYTTGHNNLYALEAMQLYGAHLSEAGVFCAWADEGQYIPRTAAQAFQFVDSFHDHLVASNAPIEYDFAALSAAVQNYQSSGVDLLSPLAQQVLRPEAILAGFWQTREMILARNETRPPLRDLTPWLEYYLYRAPEPAERALTTPEQIETFFGRVQSCDSACRDRIRSLFAR